MTMLSLMLMTITILAWTMLSSNSPMNMSILTMMMASITSMMLSFSASTWFAFILFLIYVGGMMVMFSYFVGLSSNDPMLSKSKLHYLILPLILIKSLNMQITTLLPNGSQINKLFYNGNIMTLLLLTMILLITMIIVMKMVKMNNAPLRGFSQH